MQSITIQANKNVLDEIVEFIKDKNAKFVIRDEIKNELLKDICDYKKGLLKTSPLGSKWKYLNENH